MMTNRTARTHPTTEHLDDGSQQTLLARARYGSDAAHERLLMAQADWMTAWFERELPPLLRSKLDADDLAQDARAAAWECFGAFQGESIAEYRAWMVEICSGCLLLAARRFRAALCREVTREEPFDERAIDRGEQRPWEGPWAVHERRLSELDPADEVARLLAALPARTRRIVWWRGADGRSFCAIARRLGCSPRTVRRQWHRALKEMLDRRASS
jgi:RNA polymerase sigma factor (sigma-70 family)